MRISDNNLKAVESFVAAHDWIHFLVKDKSIRSNTSVCLTLDLPADQVKALVKLLEREEAAYDIASYRDAPMGLRLWCGSTVTTEDVDIALQWLNWAYIETIKQ
jgi:phosphoserine aminotransferase